MKKIAQRLYSYLNLESTKTKTVDETSTAVLYSYLNLESTKTEPIPMPVSMLLYSYLNLESTKTSTAQLKFVKGCTVT